MATLAEQDIIDIIKDEVQAWAKSDEGRKSIKESMERSRRMSEEFERARKVTEEQMRRRFTI